ncbi:MAG: leucine-rich repeat domain-containing protein, partial [Muribaculaceae bacterium]|nr:leucine-rich repeat domain-containing protein [Muribaculaceae bacterium]
ALTHLYCFANQLTSLDVSHNTALTTLNCYSNQLPTLDVSHKTAMRDLYCSDNQLTSLDVSHNTALRTLYCDNNQINGEGMEALVASLPTVDVDRFGKFRAIGLDSETEQNVITTTQVATARGKNWKVYGFINDNWQEYDGSEPTAYLPGDFNGDGVVDVSDLNILINIVLDKAPEEPNSDLTGDGSVDVSDVNTLINLILSNE